MKVYLKPLNACPQREQTVENYVRFLQHNGHELVDDPATSDRVLVWTCAFRGDVRDNSLEQLSLLTQHHRDKVIACGCLPDIAPDLLNQQFNGEILRWKDERGMMEAVFRQENGPSLQEVEEIFVEAPLCENAAQYRIEHPGADVTFHDQFIKLMVAEGCPFHCTYCSERLAFPAFRSFDQDRLVAAARSMVEKTQRKEIILLADCVGEYGRDTHQSLTSLIRQLAAEISGARIALSNFHPSNFLEYVEEYCSLIKDGHICHISLPIQSASDRILKLMARGYKSEDLNFLFSSMRKLNFDAFDTHIIVGFPSESEDNFIETMDFLLHHRPRYVLLNRYMETPEMASFHLKEKIAPDVVCRRMDYAEAQLQKVGIVVNNENSQFAAERTKRKNASGVTLK